MRRLLTLAVAIAALVAFTSLARPDSAPSSRLRIGGAEGASEAETATADVGRRPNAGAIGGGLLRPLDIATLADLPANLLQLGPQEWTLPSLDGELLALPAFFDGGGGEVRVVDARTFSPVAAVALGNAPVAAFLGFDLEADALLVQVRDVSQPILARYPLDPGRPVTRVKLPQDVEFAGPMAASLAGGRVAMVVVERGADGIGPRPARLVVADLVDQRLLVDLRLPG